MFDTIKILDLNNETKDKLTNKFFNSILKIQFLENNSNLCDLLFINDSSIFNRLFDYIHKNTLSYTKIIVKFKKFEKFRGVLSNILAKFIYDEMMSTLNELNDYLFSDYESIDYFYDLLIENKMTFKSFESSINQKLFKTFNFILMDNGSKEELLNKENFREMILKIIFLILNSEGKYNPKNCNDIFEVIKFLLEKIKEEKFYTDMLKIFFVELYDFKCYENDISLKYEFLKGKDIFEDTSNLKLKELNYNLFNYLGNIITSFTSFETYIGIINYFTKYFNYIFCYYYPVFLNEFKEFSNDEIKKDECDNSFLLCNFFHVFKSKRISYKFYFYLINYAKKHNKKVFDIFKDSKDTLTRLFNLCPFPFYFDIIYDSLKDENIYLENEVYINELIEMILAINLSDKNKVIIADETIQKEYEKYFYNTIQLIKIFFCISQDSRSNKIFNNYKLKYYFFQLFTKIKKYMFIFSSYLINLDANNKIQKTLLEMIFIITISFININNSAQEQIDINKKIYELFLNEKEEKINNIDEDIGKSIIFIYDFVNSSSKNNKAMTINSDNYFDINYENYFYEKKSIKEEKLLLIEFIIFLYKHKANKSINIINDNEENNLYNEFLNILIDDLILLINNCSGFQKSKNDKLYNSIIDFINENSNNMDIMLKESFKLVIENKINQEINKKKLKTNTEFDYLSLIKHDENEIAECLLKEKCLLTKKESDNTPEEIRIKDNITMGEMSSYFNIETKNVVKCFKKDILLKDCSIYFVDVYFNDKNFSKIKNSFYYNYKNNLPDNDKEKSLKLLNYPSKLKNFSSNKYATPKVFLTCDTNIYKNIYFSLCYPKINKELFKKESFPLLPSHYQYYNNILKKIGNHPMAMLNCELISVRNIIFGQLDFYENFLLFKNKETFEDYKTNIKYIFSSGDETVIEKKMILIDYEEIEEVFQRNVAYNKQAIEIFLKNGKSYYFNLFDCNSLNDFYKNIDKIIKRNNISDITITKEPKSTFEHKGYTKDWETNIINNYQYLLYLNKYSDRNFSDINQYPIFPWIMLNKDYADIIENNNDNINKGNAEANEKKIYFRNMKYFIIPQKEERRQKAILYYQESKKENPKNPIHFRLHYSTGGYILLYLMRISPFMNMHIKFQGNSFDNPNRMVYDMDEILNTIQNVDDNRELIPEFFTTCEFFYNLNYVYFGLRRSDKKLVNNIQVSSIFGSLEKYIYYNRLFLNNRTSESNQSFPKCKIYHWINLIFGTMQYPTSEQSLNKFERYTYRQSISLIEKKKKYIKEGLTEEQILKKIFTKKLQIMSFGQCPVQILNNKLYNYKNDYSIYNSQTNKVYDFINQDNKIITFWVNENQNYIYFLAKNKNNKKMSILIYDERFFNKYQVFIDNIKLFNCKNYRNQRGKEKEKEKKRRKSMNINLKEDTSIKREKGKRSKSFWQSKISKTDKDFENYILSDLSEMYMLNLRDAIMDLNDYSNIYFFVGRNKDNTIKIYTPNSNGKLFGLIKTDGFISVIKKKDNDSFFTGHINGKLIEWKIIYKDRKNVTLTSYKTDEKKYFLSNISLKREIIAHKYSMITSINFNEKHNIILTSDMEGLLYIRKYYNFEFLTKIHINNNCFVNKIFLNDYDIICTMNFDKNKYKNYFSLYTINGILIEKSKNYLSIDSYIIKNGKIIFNSLSKDSSLFIFGFNKDDEIKSDNVLENLDIKEDLDNIKNFFIENNNIYILSKNGKFFKGSYPKLNSLSFGLDTFNSFIIQ